MRRLNALSVPDMCPANGPSIELPKQAPHNVVDDIKQVIMSEWSEVFQEEPLKTMSGPNAY